MMRKNGLLATAMLSVAAGIGALSNAAQVSFEELRRGAEAERALPNWGARRHRSGKNSARRYASTRDRTSGRVGKLGQALPAFTSGSKLIRKAARGEIGLARLR